MLQPAPSPLAHSRSSPAADARPLYATVLAVAGNAAGMCSGTVLCIGINSVFNLILTSVRYPSKHLHPFLYHSIIFLVRFLSGLSRWSLVLLPAVLLPAMHAVTVSLSHCLPVLLRSLSAVCHPVGFHPLKFRARLFRLRRARSAYLAILYHYRHFHNSLMITVIYIFVLKATNKEI